MRSKKKGMTLNKSFCYGYSQCDVNKLLLTPAKQYITSLMP